MIELQTFAEVNELLDRLHRILNRLSDKTLELPTDLANEFDEQIEIMEECAMQLGMSLGTAEEMADDGKGEFNPDTDQ